METKSKKEKNAVLQMLLPAVIFVVFSLTVLLLYSQKLNKIFDDTLNEQIRETTLLYSTRLRQEITDMAVAGAPAADMIAFGRSSEADWLGALGGNTVWPAALREPSTVPTARAADT